MDRKYLAAALEEVAVLLDLKGENPFKTKAYAQAARAILTYDGDLEGLGGPQGPKIKGIGQSIGAQLAELVHTGRMTFLEELKASLPAGLLELLPVPGLGPKKVKALHDHLGIHSLGELEYACHENRLVGLKGFGAKTQANILQGIESVKKYRGRFLWADLEANALNIKELVAAAPGMARVELAGSFRRGLETIKDLDLVATGPDPDQFRGYMTKLGLLTGSVSKAETKFSLALKEGPQVDIRLVAPPAFPFAWHHFTGSKEHNTMMRQRAKARGLLLNEYGLFDRQDRSPSVADEAGVFGLLDLPFIPPELREGLGEIEAAEAGLLPELVTSRDIKGFFHVHSNFSDGSMSISEIAAHGQRLGYEYLGLSDHSVSAKYAGGLDRTALDRQWDEVRRVRDQFPDIGLFWGIESDILPDGNLDYPEEILARFDFVIVSVHSHFHLPEKDMTDRIIRAVSNPWATVLGHPTGRLLLAREPYALDLPAVLAAAAESGTAIEINANPHRLDLDWREMRLARKLGLKMVICPDAHSLEGFNHVRYGVQVARKGALTRADVLNSLDRAAMTDYLGCRKPRHQKCPKPK